MILGGGGREYLGGREEGKKKVGQDQVWRG